MRRIHAAHDATSANLSEGETAQLSMVDPSANQIVAKELTLIIFNP